MTRTTRPEALRAKHDWHEHRAECARRASCDFLLDNDDLAPARPHVWLFVIWVLVVAAIALLFLAAPATARAQELWLSVNTVSWHHDRISATTGHEFNQYNWGAGLEARFDHGLVAGAGAFRNSYGVPSTYVLAAWQPLEWGWLRAGLFASAATGYKLESGHTVSPAGGLLLSLQNERFGINVIATPPVKEKHTALIGLQLKLRLV